MTQEEKKLLLEDLCARLPYETICEDIYGNSGILLDLAPELNSVTLKISELGSTWTTDIDKVKPYLRPLSSMTGEEKEEFNTIWEGGFSKALDLQIETDLKTIENFSFEGNYDNVRYLEIITAFNTIQWLLSKHFDLGLIEKGLALEASEEMYK